MIKAWLGLAIGLCALGCVESPFAESVWAAPCFEALEPWPERYPGPCLVVTDEGADGDIDERQRKVFQYDGRVSTTTTYASGEIAEERTERLQSGVTRLHETYGRDGALLSREEHVFDEDGTLLRDEIDLDGDGALDIVSTYDYSCMALPHFSPLGLDACSVSHDLDDDGDIDGTSITVRYQDGVAIERIVYDPYTEELMRVTHYPYLADQATRTFEDAGDDGSIDRIIGTDRDEETGVFRGWVDEDADGTMDRWTDSQTRGPGMHRSVDMDRDGVVRRYDVVRDRNAERVTTTYPRSPEDDVIVERRYDDSGNFLASAWDDAPLGTLDGCVSTSYACHQ